MADTTSLSFSLIGQEIHQPPDWSFMVDNRISVKPEDLEKTTNQGINGQRGGMGAGGRMGPGAGAAGPGAGGGFGGPFGR